MNKILFLLPISLFSFLISIAQSSISSESEDKFSKVYTKQQYLEDLDEFAKTLTETHPHPYEFTPKQAFWNTVEEKRQLISDRTTFSEFIWHCSEIIANLGCSHSGLGWFNQESQMLPIELRFPLEAKLIENRLYISDPLANTDRLEAGTEIFSINGISISEIQQEAFRHINSQAHIETYKRLLFNGYFTAYIPYVLGFPTSFEILIKGQKEPITLTAIESYQPKPRYHRITSNGLCQEDLCFNILEGKPTAVLTIRNFAFYGDKFPIYKSFIDNSFSEIKVNKISNLIVDLRFNGGGPSQAGAYFLQHILQEPFTYFARDTEFQDELTKPLAPVESAFQGKIYLLMDGDGHSTTGHVLSHIKASNRAILIGEELGANQFCTANQQRGLSLTHTGISYQVAQTAFFTSVQGLPRDKGIMPDHFVVQSIKDYLKGIDTVMEYAIGLLGEGE